MRLEVDLLNGLGSIRFNDVRTKVRMGFDASPKVYAQSDAEVPHDTYEAEGLFVMYDKYNRCAAVECEAPAEVIFEDRDLLKMSYTDLRQMVVQLDPDMVESDKDFISFKYGIAGFAPEKEDKPELPCESVTIFRENHFYRKIGICDPEIFSCLLVQHGFVNRILEDNQTFENLKGAYTHIFQRNTERLILLWNSFPVSWCYKEDIPSFSSGLIDVFFNMLENPNGGSDMLELSSQNIQSKWNISWDGTYVTIQSNWENVSGAYHDVLNEWGELKMLQHEFLSEWKFLFEQLSRALEDAGASVESSEDKERLGRPKLLVDGIQRPGRFYRNEMRELSF